MKFKRNKAKTQIKQAIETNYIRDMLALSKGGSSLHLKKEKTKKMKEKPDDKLQEELRSSLGDRPMSYSAANPFCCGGSWSGRGWADIRRYLPWQDVYVTPQHLNTIDERNFTISNMILDVEKW